MLNARRMAILAVSGALMFTAIPASITKASPSPANYATTKAAYPSESWILQVKTDGSNLNVRSGPGTNYSIVGKFANGTLVTFGYMDPIPSTDWTYVWGTGTNGQHLSGYCHNDYLVDYDL